MPTGIEINGGVLCDLRHLALLSQEEVAFACTHREGVKVGPAEVSQYENGAAHPTMRKLGAICAVLGVEIGSPEIRALVCARSLDTAVASNADLALGVLTKRNGNGVNANRRRVLEAIGRAGLAAALAPLEAFERIAEDRAGGVDASLLDSCESLARTLMAEFLSGDPRVIVPVAMFHAHDAFKLLERAAGPADRQRLEALVVGLNARVGLWAFHRGDLWAARKHLSIAWGTATDSGDPGLLAQAVGMSSVLYSTHSGCSVGDPKRAIALLGQADALAVHADPHTRLWVATWHADELAAVGDVQACRIGLDAADRAQELQGDEPDAGSRIGALVYGVEQQLEGVRANAAALAGRFTDADRMLDASLRSAVTVRHQVIILAQTGRVRVRADQPDGACEALVTGLDLAVGAGYAMGIERIRGVRGRFPEPWDDLACVRDLDERLRVA